MLRRIKKYMNEKVNACKEILSCAQNRMIVGLVIGGAGVGVIAIGIGLVASAYITVK